VEDGDWTLIDFAALLEKGVPPVAGGVLDQTYQFIEAARFVWAEQSAWRARKEIPPWLY